MKKVVALLGSKRKGNTYRLLGEIRALLEKHGIEFELIELYQHTVESCLGCDTCVLKGSCVLKDDVPQIMDTIAGADGVIIASPVYLQQVSGKLKTFIDRTCSWFHRPVLASKPVLCVATTKGSGLDATLAYEKKVAEQWGAIPAGNIGRTIFNLEKPVTEKEIAPFLRLLEKPETYAPTLGELISFEVEKALCQVLSKIDYDYWKERGWMQLPYFYPCRINPFKKMISGAIGRTILSKSQKKRQEQN